MLSAISYWSLQEGLTHTRPIESALDDAKQAGFDGLELCIAEEGVLTPSTDRARCEDVRVLASHSGVELQTLASGMSWSRNPVSDDPDERAVSLRLHEAGLQRAAWLGCTDMLYVPGVVCSPLSATVVRYDDAVERVRENIAALLPVASSLGVHLCLENVWNGLFYSPLELRDFVDSFENPWLGIYLDLGNLLGHHHYPPHWIELLGPRVRRVHVKDFKTSVGTVDGFCDLGDGDVPLKESITALKKMGYNRTVVAEIMPWRSGLLERTRRVLDELISEADRGG